MALIGRYQCKCGLKWPDYFNSLHMSSSISFWDPGISNQTPKFLKSILALPILQDKLTNEFLLPFANMQITVQMLDGSITPFKVRSTITVASFKAKFEPWQPMKGRALLHHDVRLDDRATLGSIPGVKNGTVLRVDKHMSQVKNRTATKKTVMSGPASSAVDEDVMESIETSGEGEETSSEDEERVSSSKRKRPSSIFAAAVARSVRVRSPVPGDMSEDPRNTTDTTLSSSAMALRTVKKEQRDGAARDQGADSEARNLDHRLHCPKVPAGNPTASAHFPQSTELVSSHQSLTGDNNTPFLSGINAAATEESETLQPSPISPPVEIISSLQCGTCRRACGCARTPLVPSHDTVPPPTENTQRRGSTSANNNSTVNGQLIVLGRKGASEASSWTGMW